MENNSESTNPVEKTYACHICDRTFIRLHRLQSHIRTHKTRKNASSAATLSLRANTESFQSPKHKNSKCIKLSPAKEASKLIGNAIAQNKSVQSKKILMPTATVEEAFPRNVPENKKDNNISSLSVENRSNSLQKTLQNLMQRTKKLPSILSVPKKVNSVSYQNPFDKEKAVTEIIITLPVTDSPQNPRGDVNTTSTVIEQEELRLNTTIFSEGNTENLTNPSHVAVDPTTVLIQTDPVANYEEEIVVKTEFIDEENEITNEAEGKTTASTRKNKVIYSCDVCHMLFNNKCHLRRHTLIHTKQKPHVCKVCFRGFSQIGNLNVHYRNHVAQSQTNPGSGNPQPPPVVPKPPANLTKEPNFKKVRLVTKLKSTYVCDECGKEFSNRCYLERHSFTHSKEKPHVCTVCFKGFAQVGNLNVHYLTHKNLKSFVCHVCDKAFTLMGSLKAHLHTHSEQKPFVCEVCGKGFSNRCFLKRHFLTHTEEKPYVCRVCQKGFAQVGNLNVHFLTHGKDKDFQCEVCNKSFSRSVYLEKHYKQHLKANIVESENLSAELTHF